jgi:hypothetical protein
MSTILLRCRDAEMLGPVCDYVSGEDPFDQAVKHLRAHAKVHNEREITDETYSSFETG